MLDWFTFRVLVFFFFFFFFLCVCVCVFENLIIGGSVDLNLDYSHEGELSLLVNTLNCSTMNVLFI
jgi:hypothetical protein